MVTFFLQEEKWYSAALKEEVDKITKEKVELEEKCSSLEKVARAMIFRYMANSMFMYWILFLVMACAYL